MSICPAQRIMPCSTDCERAKSGGGAESERASQASARGDGGQDAPAEGARVGGAGGGRPPAGGQGVSKVSHPRVPRCAGCDESVTPAKGARVGGGGGRHHIDDASPFWILLFRFSFLDSVACGAIMLVRHSLIDWGPVGTPVRVRIRRGDRRVRHPPAESMRQRATPKTLKESMKVAHGASPKPCSKTTCGTVA
eukprot:24367-Pyramimonas_sp.AAC.2